ncbi:hypothetical protein ACFL2B_01595 [Patescibacteria group bacterium]
MNKVLWITGGTYVDRDEFYRHLAGHDVQIDFWEQINYQANYSDYDLILLDGYTHHGQNAQSLLRKVREINSDVRCYVITDVRMAEKHMHNQYCMDSPRYQQISCITAETIIRLLNKKFQVFWITTESAMGKKRLQQELPSKVDISYCTHLPDPEDCPYDTDLFVVEYEGTDSFETIEFVKALRECSDTPIVVVTETESSAALHKVYSKEYDYETLPCITSADVVHALNS